MFCLLFFRAIEILLEMESEFLDYCEQFNPMVITREQQQSFDDSTECYLCHRLFQEIPHTNPKTPLKVSRMG